MTPYTDLTPAQKEQVAAQFSGDALLGSDPASYLYEVGTGGMVLCRQRAGERSPFYCILSDLLPCLCCPAPATHTLGDWDVCETHFNELAAPWPDELDEPLF